MKIYSNNYLRQNSASPCAEDNRASSFDFKEKSNFSSKNLNLAFKGMDLTKTASAASGTMSGAKKFFAKHFMTQGPVVSDYSKFLNETDALIGDNFLKSRIEEFQRLKGKDASRFIEIKDNTLIIYDRKVGGKLLSGLLDVLQLPLDILGAGTKALSNAPFIKGTKASDALKNIPVLKKRADNKASMDLYYKIKGAAQASGNPLELRHLIISTPKESSIGNYNTKDERGLNRLATGAVSSFFVGMDFHNLVMYEKNDKKEAKEAGKKRRNRELMRIGINAFMTYSVLGAFSSYASKSKKFACAAIAGSALFAEVITRLISKTPLVPLTPEGAKKYNEKQRQKGKIPPAAAQDPPNNENKGTLSFKNTILDKNTPEVFKKFASYETLLKEKTASKEFLPQQSNNILNPEADKSKKNKSPITLGRVAAAAAVAAAVNLLTGAAKAKFPKIDSFAISIEDKISKLYKKYSSKDLIVNSKTLQSLLKGFDDKSSNSIKEAYARILNVKFTEFEAQKLTDDSMEKLIHVIPENKIFEKAFKRTSSDAAQKYIEELSAKNPDGDFSDLEKILKQEIADISDLRLLKEGDTKLSNYQKFKSIDFKIDYDNPEIIDGIKYYGIKDGVYNFGAIKETKIKILLDALSYPFKAVKNILTVPGDLIKKALHIPTGKELRELRKMQNKKKEPFPIPDIGELYKDCAVMLKKYEGGKITKEEFLKYINNVNTKLLNTDTTPRYPQTSLASLSRNFVTLITSYFFINDFRNEVLIQSNGENIQKAKEVTNERIAHKLSNFVLNKFFMELFNSTFQKYYLGSLLGATTVAAATEVTNESCVRASIGVPIGNRNSREEIEEFEKKHLEQKGLKGAYYRFMARVTGKKMLSQKSEDKK